MAVRKAFRFRKFSLKTVLGTTTLKRRAFTAGGLRSLKAPFRALTNTRRGILRGYGFERYLPRQIARAGRAPLLGGFAFFKTKQGKSAINRLLKTLQPKSHAKTVGDASAYHRRFGAILATRAFTSALSEMAKDLESQKFGVNIDRGAATLISRYLKQQARNQSTTTRAGRRNTAYQTSRSRARAAQQKINQRVAKKQAQAKARQTAAQQRASQKAKNSRAGRRARAQNSASARAKTARQNINARVRAKQARAKAKSLARSQRNQPKKRSASNIRPTTSKSLRPKSSKQAAIRKMLETKRQKGQIKNIYYPAKPPKGRKK